MKIIRQSDGSERATKREVPIPPRHLRALHPRHWQFASDEVLARIIEAARIPADDQESLDHEARKSLGASLEASAQSLVNNWERPAPRLRGAGSGRHSIRRASYRRPVNFALSNFIDSLIVTYISVFDRRPGMSVNWMTRKRGGPLIRFLSTCCAEVHRAFDDPEPLEVPPAVAASIRAALAPFVDHSKRSTVDALRERVRRFRWMPTERERRFLRKFRPNSAINRAKPLP